MSSENRLGDEQRGEQAPNSLEQIVKKYENLFDPNLKFSIAMIQSDLGEMARELRALNLDPKQVQFGLPRAGKSPATLAEVERRVFRLNLDARNIVNEIQPYDSQTRRFALGVKLAGGSLNSNGEMEKFSGYEIPNIQLKEDGRTLREALIDYLLEWAEVNDKEKNDETERTRSLGGSSSKAGAGGRQQQEAEDRRGLARLRRWFSQFGRNANVLLIPMIGFGLVTALSGVRALNDLPFGQVAQRSETRITANRASADDASTIFNSIMNSVYVLCDQTYEEMRAYEPDMYQRIQQDGMSVHDIFTDGPIMPYHQATLKQCQSMGWMYNWQY